MASKLPVFLILIVKPKQIGAISDGSSSDVLRGKKWNMVAAAR